MADYTLQQLADEGGVTPRTVRYYIAQGLLASPGAGSGARYTDAHLERLRLIRQLQRNHLPLAEIRKQLDGRSALDYVQRVLNPRAEQSTFSEPPRAMFALPGAPATASVPPMHSQTATLQAPARLVGPPVRQPAMQPDRSQWDRVALTPDVELHVRRPLTRDQNRRVDRLMALARELFEEDQP
jgi:Ca-activated chloride channel family protein